MKTIQIDHELYAYLETYCRFGDTEAVAIRRLIGFDTASNQLAEPKSDRAPLRPWLAAGGKRPRADLRALVQEVCLKEGQDLQLRDYQGNFIDGVIAKVAAGKLRYQGQDYSMSALAKEHLKNRATKATDFVGRRFGTRTATKASQTSGTNT